MNGDDSLTRAARVALLLVSLSAGSSESSSQTPATLDPTPSAGSSNTWQIGAGPAVRLVPANENRVQALLIRVASLERAKAFLREKQLLGVDAAEQVTIDPSKIGGLDLRLVER